VGSSQVGQGRARRIGGGQDLGHAQGEPDELGARNDGCRARGAVVTPEQAEIARLRADVARLKMERDIAESRGVLCT
jgi:transposase-like protein